MDFPLPLVPTRAQLLPAGTRNVTPCCGVGSGGSRDPADALCKARTAGRTCMRQLGCVPLHTSRDS